MHVSRKSFQQKRIIPEAGRMMTHVTGSTGRSRRTSRIHVILNPKWNGSCGRMINLKTPRYTCSYVMFLFYLALKGFAVKPWPGFLLLKVQSHQVENCHTLGFSKLAVYESMAVKSECHISTKSYFYDINIAKSYCSFENDTIHCQPRVWQFFHIV